MFTCIADDYVFKQVRVTHSSVLDFGLLLLLGVSRVKREREKERVLCSYINGEKGRFLKLFTMKSNSSYSITHLSLSLSLSLSLFTLQQEEEKKQLLVVEGLPPSGLCFECRDNDENNKR